MIAYLHFFNVSVALQCRGYKDGILLVQLQKQLDKVCHNRILSKHTSIDISRIRFDSTKSPTSSTKMHT